MFVLSVLLLAGMVLWLLTAYNKLVHLQGACDQAIKNMMTPVTNQVGVLQELHENLPSGAPEIKDLTKVLTQRTKADSREAKIQAISALTDWHATKSEQLTDLPKTLQTLLQKFTRREDEINPQKRFYLTTVREYNERLKKFPGSLLGALLDKKTYPELFLTSTESAGIPPETKYL